MIGRNIGPYEVLAKLGQGGMGEVFRARDTRLGRDVALKILPPDVTNEPGRLERFDREARAIAALNHPHIITIYSTEEADGLRFLTMELVDGHTLSELVAPGGMPIARFLEIAIPLADALDAAHQKQITHRDLKPGNVMISNDGRVKVLDFGLARVGGPDFGQNSLAATAAPITNQGEIVGTIPYMSPEQVEGRPLDARSDLFSLGVIFYELLSGKRPFSGGSSPALMSAILRDTPAPVNAARADLPEALVRLVDRLLEKRPDDRVQTARGVFNELRKIRTQIESGDTRASSSGSSASGSSQNGLSVAVLPFVARTADDDSKALADGLTDDITSGLSRFGYLRVLSRSIVERLGRDHAEIRTQARYAVEGHVRRSGTRVRVGITLVDTQAGSNLWTETYDRDATAGIFEIEDDVVGTAVATIGDQTGVLARAMAASIAEKPLAELTVSELVIRYHLYTGNFNPVEHAELREAFERRLELEPRAAEGWAALAMLYEQEHGMKFNPRPDALGRQRQAAARAVELDPHSQLGWIAMGVSYLFARDREALKGAIERAVAINPLNADMVALGAIFLSCTGEHDRAAALVRQAKARKPQHPDWYVSPLFNYHFARGEYEDALRENRAANMPRMPLSQLAAAAVSGQLGRAAEAKAAFAALRSINPALAEPEGAKALWSLWLWDVRFVEQLLAGFNRAKKLVGDST